MDASAAARLQEVETTVLGVYDEGGCARTFRLSVPSGFSFTPGMWVMLQFPDRREHACAYSISSSPFEPGHIEVSLCKVGALTERLFDLVGGETLLMRGPFGKWVYRDDVRHAVLVSDGTGLTPFRSMARYVLDKKLPNKITILYSARTPEALLYKKDLERFAAAGMKVYTTITHPEEAAAARLWEGPRGPIDLALIERQVPDLSSAVYYLCGPKKLVETLTDGLLLRGVPREHVRYEKWGDYTWA